MTQEKSPMESRNLCGKNVAKFRNLLAGSPSQEKLAAKMQLEGLNINKNAIQRIECGKRMVNPPARRRGTARAARPGPPRRGRACFS